MTVHDMTITKLRQLPDSLVQEVSDFIDFLLMKQDSIRWQLWNQFTEALALDESDFSYGRNRKGFVGDSWFIKGRIAPINSLDPPMRSTQLSVVI